MSLFPHCAHLKSGTKMGDYTMIDIMIKDRLWDAFHGYHRGTTAENVAEKFQITRTNQDDFSVRFQDKVEEFQIAGRFDEEITCVTIKNRKSNMVIDKDEHIRHGATTEAMKSLKPAFSKDGTMTAANSSGLNEGAVTVVLMRESEANRRGLQPLARIASWATAGVNPEAMGTGPIPASKRTLKEAGWSVEDLDPIEANEAFAAQACAVNQELGWDPDIVNVNGVTIAIGHPIGASGCHVLVTLLQEPKRKTASRGLATSCIGGGMGVAMTGEQI